MSDAHSDDGLLSSDDGDQEALHGDGLLRRPPGSHSGARRLVAGAVLAAAVCAAVAALHWSSLGGRAPRNGPADAAAGTLLDDWDTQARPGWDTAVRHDWDTPDVFDPQGFFDDIATNKNLTQKYAPTSAPTQATTSAHTPAPTRASTQTPTWVPTPSPTSAPTLVPTPARASTPALTLASTPTPTPASASAPTSRPSKAEPVVTFDLRAVAEAVAETAAERVPTSSSAKQGGLPAALWPRPNKTLLFIGQDKGNIDGYIEAFGTPPGFSVYVKIDDVDNGLWGPGDWGAGTLCAECLLKEHGPNVAFNLAVDFVDTVDDVVAGVWDDNIRSIASWVKRTGGPVYMRPGYEFDGQWNHFKPTTYRLAYRRFVDLFWICNVTNVLWVWHSAVFLPNYKGLDRMEWYPGDSYVDLFGASIFTALYADGHPYKGHVRQEMEDLQDWAKLATARSKPLVIVESTARAYHMTHTKAAAAWKSWFQPMFEFIEQNDVRLFAYINCYWDIQPMWSGGRLGDTRLQANNNLTAWWIKKMVTPRWTNVFLPFGEAVPINQDDKSSGSITRPFGAVWLCWLVYAGLLLFLPFS